MTEAESIHYGGVFDAYRVRESQLKESIKVGDDTSCGRALKIDRPYAKIKTIFGDSWFKVDDLSPLGVDCYFTRGAAKKP